MNRLFILLIAFAAWSVCAQGPDEQYVRIYQMIQEADRLGETGQSRAAAAKYVEAQEMLTRFRGIYPGWNDRLINYRLSYIATKLAPLSAFLASVPGTAVPGTNVPSTVPPARATNAASVASAAVTTPPMSAEIENQLKTLQAEVDRLQADNRRLSAKLKEALSVQPAAVDPRELAKAEERIRTLQKQNELFKVQLAQKPSTPAPPDLSAKVAEQNEVITTLRSENEILKKQAAEWRQKHDALAAAANKTTSQPATQAAIPPAETETTIRNLKTDNVTLQKQVELWKQVSRTGPRPAPPANQSTALASDSERDLLVALRARLDVLEAKPVPYTPEELALFDKGSPTLAPGTETASIPSTTGAALPAEGPLRKVERGVPTGAGALVRTAVRAFEAGRYAEAEQRYLELIRQAPENVTVLANLASAQVELGRVADYEKDPQRALRHFADAEQNVQRVLQLAPDDDFGLYLLGRIRYRQDKLDQALDALSRSAKANPNYAEAQNFLGIVLSEKGLRGAAEVALRKAVQLQPNNADAHYNLAVVYAMQKPPAFALARWHYKKARNAGHPGNADVEKLLQ